MQKKTQTDKKITRQKKNKAKKIKKIKHSVFGILRIAPFHEEGL